MSSFFRNSFAEKLPLTHGNVYVASGEAVINAVYHRSYEIREPIEVRVLPDEITVASYRS